MPEEWTVIGTIGSGMVSFIIALARGWLLLPTTVKELRSDRDFWRERAWDLLQNTEQAANAIEGSHDEPDGPEDDDA